MSYVFDRPRAKPFPPRFHSTNRMQDEEGNYKLPLDEVTTIKQQLIGLMISSPPAIQSQLGEAISLIADSDFWEKWDTLTQVCLKDTYNTACMLFVCARVALFSQFLLTGPR